MVDQPSALNHAALLEARAHDATLANAVVERTLLLDAAKELRRLYAIETKVLNAQISTSAVIVIDGHNYAVHPQVAQRFWALKDIEDRYNAL